MKLPAWLGGGAESPKNLAAPAPAPTTPDWMRRDTVALPGWARIAETHSEKVSVCIEADTAGYIKEWFGLLNVETPDQYWLEVAYQCAKMDLQTALLGTQYDPRTSGKPAEFHFSRAPEYALTAHPKGKGVEAASKGREAREHYRRIRGRLPF